MVGELRIYFEGHKSLRPDFHRFLCEIRENALRVRLVAGGARAVEDFKDALRSHPRAWNILLKDSEGPDNGSLFRELQRKHGLDEELEGSVFWMVSNLT